jgi:hypothetical protein
MCVHIRDDIILMCVHIQDNIILMCVHIQDNIILMCVHIRDNIILMCVHIRDNIILIGIHIREMIRPEVELNFTCYSIVCKPSSHIFFLYKLWNTRSYYRRSCCDFIIEDTIVTVKCRTALTRALPLLWYVSLYILIVYHVQIHPHPFLQMHILETTKPN